jgi:AraC-like DNA-binding protein
MFESKPNEVLTTSAIHGVEQQLIHALVKCLSNGTSHAAHRSSIMLRFEDACATYADRTPPLVEICAMLNIPERTLRTLCEQHIGMGPMAYLRLRRMNSVRRALSLAYPADSTVAELARRHGFTELGRFAATYRKLFGELPSATLQQKVVLQPNSRCIDASRLWT